MFSDKRKFRLCVIELFLLKIDERILPPLMLGVTGFAAGGIDLPMETLFPLDIALDLFMASKALLEELLLPQDMAFEAAPLDLFVKRGDLPRHDSFKDVDGGGRAGRAENKEEDQEKKSVCSCHRFLCLEEHHRRDMDQKRKQKHPDDRNMQFVPV